MRFVAEKWYAPSMRPVVLRRNLLKHLEKRLTRNEPGCEENPRKLPQQ